MNHDTAIAKLRNAAAKSRLAQSYLLTGGTPQLRTRIATTVAQDVNCQEKVSCGSCESCRLIQEEVHPDIVKLEGEGASGQIPIQAIRQRLIPLLAHSPHQGNKRIVIISNAEQLAGPSANALLKTLEEPPAHTHFFLGADNAIALLPTIRSRCVTLSLGADNRISLSDDSAALYAEIEDATNHQQIAHLVKKHKDREQWVQILLHHSYECRSKLVSLLANPAETAVQIKRIRQALDLARKIERHNAHLGLAIESWLLQEQHVKSKRTK